MSIKMTIKEFADQSTIPEIFTCDGINQIPTISWEQAQVNAKSFIFILDAMLKLLPDCSKIEILAAMENHILAQVTIIGLYERSCTKNKK